MEKQINPITKDQTELHSQKEIEKKKVFLGSATVRPGHRCFEVNTKTNDIVEAEYKYEATYGKATKKTVTTKEDCVYILALNKKNALKHFNKLYK